MPVFNAVPWWKRLGVRLSAAILLVTLAAMALFAMVLLNLYQRHLTDQVVEDAALLSETLKRSTYYHMLEDRREELYRALRIVGDQDRIERARLFNKEGRITFSTHGPEVGTFVDKRAESCYACHAADQPLTRLNLPSRSRVYGRGGHRVLGLMTPIYNEPACSTAACHTHPAQRSVIGVIDLGLTLEPIDREAARLRRLTFGATAVTMFVIAGLVTLFTQRRVGRPVKRLVMATRRIASGDLQHQVPVESDDELGVLASSFNEMEQSLARMRAERLKLLDSLEQQVEERTAALKQAQARLVQSEKLSSLGRLAASVAHEINNPLAGILTYAKLLIRTLEPGAADDPDRARAVKHLQLVQRETERCTAIVRNLLDFARERPLTLVDLSVNGVLDEALVLVTNQARLQNIELVKEFGATLLVHADFGQLRQAFINIVINACDAMPQGGRLVLTTEDTPAGVAVQVTDTGTGIPHDVLSKVLDPFFTTKEKGTGLGLSVVYGIVERLGGALTIDSTVGVGTTVQIMLPAATARRPAAAGSGVPGQATAPGAR
jgi:two-component system NtrC family sensor kinase